MDKEFREKVKKTREIIEKRHTIESEHEGMSYYSFKLDDNMICGCVLRDLHANNINFYVSAFSMPNTDIKMYIAVNRLEVAT